MVNVLVPSVSGMARVSGTSYATPFVTGSAALLMEWGIVRGNDTFLYGEKLKAYLIKGAEPLAGAAVPDTQTGLGKTVSEKQSSPGIKDIIIKI